MAASIREALENAIDQEEKVDVAPAASESVSAVESAPDSSVEAASAVDTPAETPASKPEDAPKADAAEKPAAPAADAKPKEQSPEEVARQHRIDRPPQSWKKEAKGEWANLPLHIRQEVHKREAEITRALNQSAPDRQLAEQFKQVVSPYMARIQANGVNPLQAADHLFRADYVLATAPKEQRAKFMADLIKQYDVDINALDEALAGVVNPQQQSGGTDIAALVQQQLQQALAPLMQREQRQRQQAHEEIVHTVESMGLDPKYPHFEEVREDMADLMEIANKRGLEMSLEEAYTRATRMNPDVFGQLERQTTMSNANQQHLQAQRAKAAASSVTGSPSGGGTQQHVGDGSLRGAIEAAFGGQRL